MFNLGLKELLTIKNHRKVYVFNEYEIVLEKVDQLGVFLEVEYKGKITEKEIQTKRKEMQDFIDGLGLEVSRELNAGKPELFINRHKIIV